VTRLSALWAEQGLESPPLIAVNHPVAAMGPLLSLARAELDAVNARCAELQNALVRTREEFEETRTAMQGAMRTLSYRYATKMNLVAASAPSAEKVKIEGAGTVRQTYPIGTHLLTCFALHVSETRLDADAILTLVLTAAESGRVLGEWRIPGNDVRGGWNAFDFPTPVASVHETIALDVSLQTSPGCWATFSLAEETTAAETQLLAIRIWTADPGGRFPLAAHWVWSALGETLLAPGTVSMVTDDFVGRMKLFGGIKPSRRAKEGFPAAYTLRGGSSHLWLRRLDVRNTQAVCFELKSTVGDVRHTHFELIAQSAQHCFGSGARWFGLPEKTLRLGLTLPDDLPSMVDFCLRIEDGKRAPDDFAVVEVLKIEVISGKRARAASDSVAERPDPEALPQAGFHQSGPSFASLEARNYSKTDKYELVELTLENLEFDGYAVPVVKFKASIVAGRLTLEFRRGPRWPEIFRKWPGRHKDIFSERFHVAHSGERLMIDADITNDVDRELIAALSRLMPIIAGTMAQRIPDAAERSQTWVDAARAFASAAGQTSGTAK
jgi:hypothetical protein